jgi:hypothetical protein
MSLENDELDDAWSFFNSKKDGFLLLSVEKRRNIRKRISER